MRAVVYARLSRVEVDQDERIKQQANLDEQVARGVAEAERRGWTVVERIVDAGKSGVKDDGRPGMVRILELIEAKKVDAVIVREVERLWRDDVKGLLFKRTCHVVGWGDGTDTTREGETEDLAYGLRVLMGTAEYKKKRRNVVLSRQRLRDAGRARIGGPRAYGFEPDGVTPRPAERRLIRKSARLFADSGSLRSIVKLWADAGIKSSTGTPVPANTIKRVLIADGDRIMNGEAPVILNRDIAIRVRDIFMDPRRRSNREGLNRKHFLLSGLAHCECGGKMYGARVGRARDLYYRCHAQTGGCGRTYIKAANVEEWVRASVETNRAELPAEGPDLTAEETALREEHASVMARAANLGGELGKGKIGIESTVFKAALDMVEREDIDLRRQLADLAHRRAAQETVHEFVARMRRPPEDFDGARQLIHATVKRVTVRGAGQRNDVHPRDRVSITWQPEFSADEYGPLDAEDRDRPGPGDLFEMAAQLAEMFDAEQLVVFVNASELAAGVLARAEGMIRDEVDRLAALEEFRTLDRAEIEARVRAEVKDMIRAKVHDLDPAQLAALDPWLEALESVGGP